MTYLYDNSYCTKCLIAILLIAVPAIAGLPLSPGAGDNITGNSSEMVESTAGASSNGTEVELTPSTSPHAPYDCSAANSTFRQARAIASFKKGLNLIDDLRERSLGVSEHNNASRACFQYLSSGYYYYYLWFFVLSPQRLIVTQQKGCPPNDITLSMLNVADYPDLRRTGLQGMADSVAKVKVYAALVKKSLDANYSDDMQALYDILQGITKEIYILVSSSTKLLPCEVGLVTLKS